MNELDKLRELRQYISRAREACAGSDINNYDKVNLFLEDAKFKAAQLDELDLAVMLSVMKCSIFTQKERLEVDSELCNILNDLDKRIKELEYNG